MIGEIEATVKIGSEERAFRGRDIDTLIADIDSYIVSRK